MKFTCDKSDLQNACNTAARAVAAKSPIEALEGFLIETTDVIKITGYDLKKGIYTEVEGNVNETGKMVLPAKMFSEMLRRMPDGTLSFVSDESNNIKIRCGKSSFNVVGIDGNDYPELPSVDGINKLVISQKILKSMINQTIFATSDNEARPIYTGTLFDVSGDSLTMVSIDGFRLAKRTEKIENQENKEYSFVVPASSLSDIEKLCSEGEENKIEIFVGQKHILFGLGKTHVVSRRLEGDFINYKKSIPTSFKYKINIERQDFMSSVNRMSLVISEKNKAAVRMTFNDGEIEMYSFTALGRAEDTCFCEGDGEGMEIGFSDKYIMDALKASNSDKVCLSMNTSSTPCLITDSEDESKYTFMILPVRIKTN